MSLPQTRSTTTFSSGSSLTIVTNTSTTLITRHPRTIPTRLAETRSKSLLTELTTTPPTKPSLLRITLHLTLPLLTLLPLSVHILHRNALITTLTHVPASLLTLLLLYLSHTFPHISYLAVTSENLIHRPRGLLRAPRSYSLATIRGFAALANRIVSDSLIRRVSLVAPDHETASTAAQALNKALSARGSPRPVDAPPEGDGIVVTGATPLSEVSFHERLRVERLGDRLLITTRAPRFPRFTLLVLYFLLTHLLASLLLIFVFDDISTSLDPAEAASVAAIAVGGGYLLILGTVLLWYVVRCVPRKWRLVVAGYRKDVEPGMIDVGRCREVVLSRKKHSFRVRIVSSTGNAFLDIGRLCEAEATTLLVELRDAFPGLFQIGV